MSGACSALATGWPGIAVPPGSAHSPQGEKQSNKEEILKPSADKFCVGLHLHYENLPMHHT